MSAPVVVDGLRKQYGSVVALDGISFSVEEGEVFGLLGPNGAGKTTSIEILEGYRRPTAGRVQVLGQDPALAGKELRDRIGIMLQEAGLEPQLRVEEALRLYQSVYSRPRDADEVLQIVGLEDLRSTPLRALSGGNRRRLDLALALVGDPELIFLDEPTTGFDPAARRRAWDLIENLRTLGRAILLTTHYLEEAQRLADRVAVLNRGVIVAIGPPDELVDTSTTIRFRIPPSAGDPPLRGSVEGGYFSYNTDRPIEDLHLLTSWALERGLPLESLEVRRPSLEDTYLRIVGE